MASINEDENLPQEETGRRTRSGRKTTQVSPVSVRATRRSSRKATTEQVEEHIEPDPQFANQSEIIQAMLAEAAQGAILEEAHEQSSELHDEQIVETTQIDEDGEMEISDQIQQQDVVNSVEFAEEIIQYDEKSSSFPFGNVQNSEHSNGGKNDEIEEEENNEEEDDNNTVGGVNSSILASLAGDNANSLPSAGEESIQMGSFEVVTEETLGDNDNISSSSEPAIAEEVQGNHCDSDATIANNVDAEMVSEDELPPPAKAEINDAEEVSDDELPAPQRAELPADAEVVSDDELPSSSGKTTADGAGSKRKVNESKDEKYNPGSPTGESNDGPVEKKAKLDTENSDEKDKKKEKKKLPDLDKFWKAVKDDATDFTGWTYLLQYVDNETDVEAAREAYDAFLSHYPYCYGYWRKYADYEKRKGEPTKCDEVFERGLKAIPLSVDLWIHYLTHVKLSNPNNEEHIRQQFERALNSCGLEFRSDKLWDAFIKWETEGKRYREVVRIYDRLLGVPTQGYNGHFDNFQDLVNNQPPSAVVSVEEFKKLRREVRDAKSKLAKKEKEDELSEGPPGEDIEEADDHVKDDEEASAIREKIKSTRRKIHKATVAAVTARWTYEEGIKRPYFHVKPLEQCQLKNWKDYLDFEIEKGDRKRVLVLFERCLIACALYDEFWLKLIRYLESQNDPELIPVTRHAFERACTIHHPDKPSIALLWSAFEECQHEFDKAAEILDHIEKRCPSLLQIAYRRVNLERRRSNYDKCKELYEHYISTAKSKNIAGSLSIKYARFLHKILKDLDGGFKVLKDTLAKDPNNTRIALHLIDLALQRPVVDEKEVVEIMDKFVSRDGMDPDQKVLFAQRKVEFLEDFGSTAKGLQDAQRALQVALAKANEAKKKSESGKNASSKDTTNSSATASSQSSSAAYNNSNASSYNYNAGSNAAYYGSGQQQSYQSYDSYGYNHWQYGSTGYNNYSQWSGYGNYY